MSGFPPDREIRENFEDFSSQGNQQKTGGFNQNQGKNLKSGNFFSKPFSNLFFQSCQEIALNEAIFVQTNVTKATFKKNKYVFLLKCLGLKLRKNQGKILGNQGKVSEFHWIKKWEPCVYI